LPSANFDRHHRASRACSNRVAKSHFQVEYPNSDSNTYSDFYTYPNADFTCTYPNFNPNANTNFYTDSCSDHYAFSFQFLNPFADSDRYTNSFGNVN
jgi:hypothetical protein